MTAQRRQSGPFRVGDRVQLTGPKGTLNTVTLEAGGSFHSHRGVLSHDLIIGAPDGSVITSSNDVEYLALRPLLTDFGLARRAGEPWAGGTPGYLSPRRLVGAPAALSDDVYALGRLLDDVALALGDRAPATLRALADRCLGDDRPDDVLPLLDPAPR